MCSYTLSCEIDLPTDSCICLSIIISYSIPSLLGNIDLTLLILNWHLLSGKVQCYSAISDRLKQPSAPIGINVSNKLLQSRLAVCLTELICPSAGWLRGAHRDTYGHTQRCNLSLFRSQVNCHQSRSQFQSHTPVNNT